LGDALRERASEDPGLRESLARGDLAPEPLVQELVAHAVTDGDEPGLLVDGFPRHTEQVPLAQELFGDWTVIHLDVPVFAAATRLAARLVCATCGFVGSVTIELTTPCPTCGKNEWHRRLEDDAKTIQRRLHDSDRHLEQLLKAIHGHRVIRLDAAMTVDRISDCAVRELMTTRLA
jgi:adenylate kinase family enzyme